MMEKNAGVIVEEVMKDVSKERGRGKEHRVKDQPLLSHEGQRAASSSGEIRVEKKLLDPIGGSGLRSPRAKCSVSQSPGKSIIEGVKELAVKPKSALSVIVIADERLPLGNSQETESPASISNTPDSSPHQGKRRKRRAWKLKSKERREKIDKEHHAGTAAELDEVSSDAHDKVRIESVTQGSPLGRSMIVDVDGFPGRTASSPTISQSDAKLLADSPHQASRGVLEPHGGKTADSREKMEKPELRSISGSRDMDGHKGNSSSPRADHRANLKDARGKNKQGRDAGFQGSKEFAWKRKQTDGKGTQEAFKVSYKQAFYPEPRKADEDPKVMTQPSVDPVNQKSWVPRKEMSEEAETRVELDTGRAKDKHGRKGGPQHQDGKDLARQKFEAALKVKKDELLQRSKQSMRLEIQKVKRNEIVRRGYDDLEAELEKNLFYEGDELFFKNS